jgi:hypothetical protein
MPDTSADVVGPILLPSGDVPAQGKILFTLNGWDVEGDTTIIPGPTSVDLDEDGDFTAPLWCTTEGERSVSYRAKLSYWSVDRNRLVEVDLSSFVLEPGGPYNLSELLAQPPVEMTGPDVLAVAQAAAISAATDADRAEAAADRIDLGEFDTDVAAAAADADAASAAAASASEAAAELANDAAQLSRGIFASTAAGLSKGVVSTASLVGGSGGTNGTFALAFSGGAGSNAAGDFVVAGGAVTQINITNPGTGYTSAPTISFAASSGLTGASATAVIDYRNPVGTYFSVPGSGNDSLILYSVGSGPAATEVVRYPTTAITAALYTRKSDELAYGRYRERFGFIDTAAQTFTNLTDGASATKTVTKVSTGLQIALTTTSRTFAISTENDLREGKTRINYLATCTFASVAYCGFGAYSGSNRWYVTVSQDGWIVLVVDGTAATITSTGTSYSTGATVAIDAWIDLAAGSGQFRVSINGQAPYTFGATGLYAGDVELIQRGNSTVIHALDIEPQGVTLGATLAQASAADVAAADRGAIGAAKKLLATMERVAPPAFDPTETIPISVYKSGSTYFTSVDLQPILSEDDPSVHTFYVDTATGSDTNAGTSAAPLKSLAAAGARVLTKARAIIKAKGGLYRDSECFPGGISGTALQIVSWDGVPVVSAKTQPALSWALDTGTTYIATFSNGIAGVHDAANLSSEGDYKPLTLAASAAACRSTANSYYITGTTIYVNLFDARAPDSNLRIYKKAASGTADNYNLRLVSANQTVYLENIWFEGGVSPFVTDSSSDSNLITLYARSCRFLYGAGSNGFNWVSPGLSILQECIAARSSQDGFDYNRSGFGSRKPLNIEVDCIGRSNGTDASGTNNGSTAHGSDIIRVNGLYYDNENRQVHDILNSVGVLSWNLGCTARDARAGAANRSNFAAGLTGEAAGSKMWLDGCTSSGSAYDLEANGGAIIYTSGLTSGGVNGGTGTITTYTP